ncbi:myosin light chain kinase 2, skeletal/cardiac muscle isoform X2 [Hypomesus transpacificus]|uniref:myosin light chain kinase 2, skeletal/cardiac muscle isoform X2 n=1 Tax=Hypomesus transpacificus TaxID=137520 RepID=UPI001F079B56|nr:myosin light chain kinase 2, skeletal/cardiac muscle isoform X2 [Hypomesus transpacificus]
MGSEQSPAHFLSLLSLEAKVDNLSYKLDQLFSRGNGSCPICSTCSLHTSRWEAAERHLSDQSRLLERLEKRIDLMHNSLDGHVKDKVVEDRSQEGDPTEKQSIGAQDGDPTEKQSMGAQDGDHTKKQSIGAQDGNPTEKQSIGGNLQQLGVQPMAESKRKKERKGTAETVMATVVVPSTVVSQKIQKTSITTKGDTPNQLDIGQQGKKQQTGTIPPGKGDESSMGEQPIRLNLQEVRCKPVAVTTAVTTVPYKTTPTLITGKLDIKQARTQSHPSAHSKKGENGSASERPTVFTGGKSVEADTTNDLVIQQHGTKQHPLPASPKKGDRGSTSDHQILENSQMGQSKAESRRSSGKDEAVVDAIPNQSMQVPPKTGTTVMTVIKPTAVVSQLVPQKKYVLSVPTPTTTESSSLRHVHSCPESLQRLQCPGPVPPPVFLAPGTSQEKSSSTVRGTGPGSGSCSASGIHIRVDAAAPDRTTPKTPPKTCYKVIDDVPPQPAPFLHRCVALRSNPPSDAFIVHSKEILGGGRFGKVHRCTEKLSVLKLAAKVINTRNSKEKEMAMNEVQVMNQLNHANILQLYEAFETKNQVVLILEYVEGGELFDRIVDESTPLTEVDAMVFVKQICEGIHYMHQMFVLHLDLKPENILCVNRTSHQVKIIDFGLARRYKPREKMRVNFGTPEFLAPEVVDFDFVSFPTDMWTLGVVTYMLLSGLSPFLGDDESQTLNNVLAVNWYFEEEAFEHISAEARDFISNLLIREKGGRLSAAKCLKHPWLNNISEKAKHNNIVLKSQVLLKKYMAKRLWRKNYIAIAAANRFKKISSSGSLTSLGF